MYKSLDDMRYSFFKRKIGGGTFLTTPRTFLTVVRSVLGRLSLGKIVRGDRNERGRSIRPHRKFVAQS